MRNDRTEGVLGGGDWGSLKDWGNLQTWLSTPTPNTTRPLPTPSGLAARVSGQGGSGSVWRGVPFAPPSDNLSSTVGVKRLPDPSSVIPRANAASGGNPLPDAPPSKLTEWFGKEGNMNMLGAGAVGVDILTGLAGTMSNLKTAGKQRELLSQQLAHNASVRNNRQSLINQLKGSY